MASNADIPSRGRTDPAALFKLTKPITWFPPVWAYLCGTVSAGVAPSGQWGAVALGLLVAGPLVCGMSQVVNDWADRDVDAINEPGRPIPSGRVTPGMALAFGIAMTMLALLAGYALGPWGFGASCVAILAAWAYSVPPLRLKRRGLRGPAVVALCYEGIPWFTGAAVLAAGAPSFFVVTAALLYSAGAVGIMVLNDFKAIEGDRAMGIRSLPAMKGPAVAARIVVTVMILPQAVLAMLLLVWGRPVAMAAILLLVIGQCVLMRRFLADPVRRATWLSGVGVPLYVAGMMVTAFAIRGLTL